MKSELSGYISAFDFLLGEWQVDMVTMPEGSTVGRRATLHVRRILDGAAILDEIRHVDQAGEVNFRGEPSERTCPIEIDGTSSG